MVWVAASAGVDGNALGAGNMGEGARFSVGATAEDVAIDVGRLPTAVGSPDDAETPAVGTPLPDTDVEGVLHATSAKSAIAIVSPMRIVVLPSRLYAQYCRSVIDSTTVDRSSISIRNLPSAQALRAANCEFVPQRPVVYCKRAGVQKNPDIIDLRPSDRVKTVAFASYVWDLRQHVNPQLVTSRALPKSLASR